MRYFGGVAGLHQLVLVQFFIFVAGCSVLSLGLIGADNSEVQRSSGKASLYRFNVRLMDIQHVYMLRIWALYAHVYK